MATPTYTAAVLTLLGLAAATRALLPPIPIAQAQRIRIDGMPRQIGAWTVEGKDRPIPKEVYTELPRSEMVDRSYRRDDGSRVDLLLLTSDREHSYHDPKACFPGHGWKWQPLGVATVGGLTVRVSRASRADRPEARARVYYWWVGRDPSVPGEPALYARVRALRSSIVGDRGLSLFVRVVAIERPDGSSAAEAFLPELAAALRPILDRQVPNWRIRTADVYR